MMKLYRFLRFGYQASRPALALLLAGSSLTAAAQSLNYEPTGAAAVAGTYVDLGTMTTSTLIATSNTDNANSAAQAIGFSFAYNGSIFTQFVLNTNGAVRLGSTAPAAALYYDNNSASTSNTDPLASTASANSNLLMPFNFDLVSGTGGAEYRVATTGAVGSRVCTIQWKNVSDKTGAGADAANVTQFANFSFQLKLYETSNRIEFVYGPVTASTGALSRRYINVGLKGSGLNQGQLLLATKLISSTWSTTSFQDANYTGSYYSISNETLPALGSTYRFVPTTATAIVSSLSPDSGPVGTSLTLNGTNLTGTSLVTFGGTSGNTVSTGFVVNAAGTQITGIIVPAGAQTGTVSVTTPVGPATSPSVFTVVPTVPTITSFTPGSALPGASVTVTGTNFTGATALTLNGVSVPGFTVVNATTITFSVPATATSGVLAVTTPKGTGSSAASFTVLPTGPPLVITAVGPAANALGVVRTAPVAVTFDQPLAAASAAALQVYSAQRGGLLTLARPATVSGSTLSFTPGGPGFQPGETITGIVTAAASGSGSAGALLAAPYVYQFTTATAEAKGTFAPRAEYATGEGPYSVALGDVNGDGLLDMVTANHTAYTFSVRLGQADGTFAATKTDYAARGFASCVALGDVNGDGRLDVVLGLEYGHGILVALNQAGGGFTTTAYAATESPYAVALGDVNGDGRLDIVTADNWDYSASVLLGKAGGGFTAYVRHATGAVPLGVALGDLNGDGRLDIVTANNANSTATVLLGLTDGGFTTRVEYATGLGPRAVALGDMNGDGRLDIVTANYIGNVSVLLGQAGGGFAAKVEYGAGMYTCSVALGDVNGDGRLDIVTANYEASTTSVLLSQAGGFAAPVAYPTGGQPYGVALGDVNGDGRLDMVAANRTTNTAAVLLGQGTAPVVTGVKPLAGSSLAIYPNPTVTGRLTVELTGYLQPAELTVLNALGQVVFTTHTAGSPGKTALVLDLHQLVPGIYTLLVKTEGGLDTRRLIRD